MRTDSTQNQYKLIKNNRLLHYHIAEMECLEEEMNFTLYRVIFAHVIFAVLYLQMVLPRLEFTATKLCLK